MILRSRSIPQPAFQADPAGDEVAFSFENVNMLTEAYAVIVLLEAPTGGTGGQLGLADDGARAKRARHLRRCQPLGVRLHASADAHA